MITITFSYFLTLETFALPVTGKSDFSASLTLCQKKCPSPPTHCSLS